MSLVNTRLFYTYVASENQAVLAYAYVASENQAISNHDTHLFELESRNKLLRAAHLDTQSMTSTYETYPFDIFTLSETWLNDNKLLLQFVSIPGYTHVF